MVNRKFVAVAAVLGTTLALSAGADESSPCRDGRRHLIREWQAEGLPGTKNRPTRTSIECLADGGLRQIVEISKDNGKTWEKLFESTYRPGSEAQSVAVAPEADSPMAKPPSAERQSAAPPPAPPAPDKKNAQPQAVRQVSQEGSSVKAVTRELEREEIPKEQAPQLVMESPMVLEVTPGNISRYPKNAGWRSEETAAFICDEVVLKQAGVGRKIRGDSVDLIVEARLFTHKRQKNVDLAIEVIHAGQVVASDELRNIRLGLSIPGHDREGMMTSVAMRISQELFDEMFAGDNRPVVRFTLTVH